MIVCWLFVGCLLLFVNVCSVLLFVAVRCYVLLLSGVGCCLLVVGCCLLFVACCVLLVVCSL